MRERRAVTRLLRFYRPGAGRFVRATGAAWQLALAIEAVTVSYERTGDLEYLRAIRLWFARHAGRRSRFYDDDGWYLNAWLRAYEATGDGQFLLEARAGFADMRSGWDDVCGGGLWWSRERTYKNAITNGLFILAAARMARLGGVGDAGDWAGLAWRWFDASGLINNAHLVNDGLRDCRNNGGTTWTYNQGVIVSGLVELARATGEAAYLDRARQIASAAMSCLAGADGVLREPSEPDADRDQEIFKGILAQGLGRLCRADPAGTGPFAAFLRVNAESVWQHARDSTDAFGVSWSGPPRRVTAASHASATLLLTHIPDGPVPSGC